MPKPDRQEIQEWFMGLQDDICSSLESLDGKGVFHQDLWDRPDGGGGRSRVLQGQVVEKGGVNFSAVHGPMPEKISSALGLGETDFFATGVSIVLHPHNPFIPIIHMNVRYFEANGGDTYWFGGGIDVTPHYIQDEDASFFHSTLKAVCDKTDATYYEKHKEWADNYFYLPHRKETRGIGGIFFDRLTENEQHSKEDLWTYVQNVGSAFVPIYSELVRSNVDKAYGDDHQHWQKLRRGRYVEFNLVWDRGTKFGLETNGRTESILMSMPPRADWIYNYEPQQDSQEAYTQEHLKKGINWIKQS